MNACRARRLLALALPLVATDCSLISLDDLSKGVGSSASSGGEGGTATQTSASVTSSAGGGGAGQGGIGGTAGATGSGGEVQHVDPRTDLVNDALLVRYYLDEARSGLAPEETLDYAPSSLDLPLEAGSVSYATVVGNRGLSWPGAELGGGPKIPVSKTKLEVVAGLTEATLEAVLNVTEASVWNSRIIHMGSGQDSGRLTLNVVAPIDPNPMLIGIALRQEGDTFDEVVARYDVDMSNLGRVVLHGIVDLGQADIEDRVRLYVDGVRITRFDGAGTRVDIPIALEPIVGELIFALGNRGIGDRSFAGNLFYGAVYQTAFDDAQVQQNAAALLAGDDSTPP